MFNRIIDVDTKIQLLKQLGYVGQNIIKTLIRIHHTQFLQSVSSQNFYELMFSCYNPALSNKDNVSWLFKLFSTNNISIPDFFAHFHSIHSLSLTKINTLILQGPTNTGKSLLLSLLLADTHPTRIARERDKSNFHLDQLPNSTSVIFEEPIIDQTTIGTWKLLLEGAPIPTDIKHADKELIPRLPVFISTNHPIYNWLSSEEIAPINQRVFTYKLHRQISSYLTPNQPLPSPPHLLTKHDMYSFILLHLQEIHDKFSSLQSSTTLDPLHKVFTHTHFLNLQSLQISYLLQDPSDSDGRGTI
jgi:hypothetical protein